MTNRNSRFPGFYKITVRERRELVAEATGVSIDEMTSALETGGLDPETADKFVENVLGTYALPFGVALNVRVNGKDYVVPMVVEEPSVISAASNAAKMERGGGANDLEVRALQGDMLVVHIYVDCRDAMGANLVNNIAEAVGNQIAELGGGRRGLRILSNLCDRRC